MFILIVDATKSINSSASDKRKKKGINDVMKRTKSEKFNCKTNLANKNIQNRKSFNKKTPRIIAPVTNMQIMNPKTKNFDIKSSAKIKFHHGTIVTDHICKLVINYAMYLLFEKIMLYL